MSQTLYIGQKAKVRYVDGYTAEVEVTEVSQPGEFVGRLEAIFSGGCEVIGGDVLELRGTKIVFRAEDILLVGGFIR